MPEPHIQREPTTERAFAQLVRERREAIGWSQDELARRVSSLMGEPFHQTGIARIEGGSRNIRLNEASALVRALGINPVTAMNMTRHNPTNEAHRIKLMMATLDQRLSELLQRLGQADAELSLATMRRDSIVAEIATIRRSIDELNGQLIDIRGYGLEHLDGE